MIQSIVNFCIFLSLFALHEFYDQYRLKNQKTWYVVTEVKGFKLFFLMMGLSTLVLDYFMDTTSYFTYAVFLGLLYHTKREISSAGVRVGFKLYDIRTITSIVLCQKNQGAELTLWINEKQITIFIRQALTTGLESAVEMANEQIRQLHKKH